jgi:hypothetical protein
MSIYGPSDIHVTIREKLYKSDDKTNENFDVEDNQMNLRSPINLVDANISYTKSEVSPMNEQHRETDEFVKKSTKEKINMNSYTTKTTNSYLK